MPILGNYSGGEALIKIHMELKGIGLLLPVREDSDTNVTILSLDIPRLEEGCCVCSLTCILGSYICTNCGLKQGNDCFCVT
jgi:hypothetical protein